MSMVIIFAKKGGSFPYEEILARLGPDVELKREERYDPKSKDEVGLRFQQKQEPWTRGTLYSDRVVFATDYLPDLAWVRELARLLDLAFMIDGLRID